MRITITRENYDALVSLGININLQCTNKLTKASSVHIRFLLRTKKETPVDIQKHDNKFVLFHLK